MQQKSILSYALVAFIQFSTYSSETSLKEEENKTVRADFYDTLGYPAEPDATVKFMNRMIRKERKKLLDKIVNDAFNTVSREFETANLSRRYRRIFYNAVKYRASNIPTSEIRNNYERITNSATASLRANVESLVESRAARIATATQIILINQTANSRAIERIRMLESLHGG